MHKALRIASIVLNDFQNDNRVLKVCKSLVKKGHKVEVACLHRPGLPLKGSKHGVPFQRIKLRCYSFPYSLSALKFMEFALKLRFKYANFDVWIANDFEALVAYDVAKKLGLRAKLIYDSHEYQSHIESVKTTKRRNFIQNTERRILKKNTPVFHVSQGIFDAYENLYGLQNQRLLMNLPESCSLVNRSDLFRTKFSIHANTTIFLYQGKMTAHRGLEEIIEAFVQLKDENLVLVLMGFGDLVEEVKKMASLYAHIHYHPAVDIQELPAYTSSADWGISNLQNTCLNHYYSLPNKIFEYIQAGVPVLASDMYDSKKMIEKYEIGSIMNSNAVEDIKTALIEAKNRDRSILENKLKIAREELCWEKQEFKIYEAIESLNIS